MFDASDGDQSLVEAAAQFTNFVSKIQSAQQLCQFLPATSQLTGHRHRKNRVQPTSTARRKDGPAPGSYQRRSKRPLLAEGHRRVAVAVKRLRSLSAAVRDNKPNLKSHGTRH